jgi:thymidylate kinase
VSSTKSSGRGAYIALIGIDGIGKTTLAAALRDRLISVGHKAELMSWRRYVMNKPARETVAFPRPSMESLWVESFRLFLGGALVDRQPWRAPSTLAELNATGGAERLNGRTIENVSPSGPYAAAWVELAANVLLRFEVIQPMLDAGVTIIQDSFGYKHLCKYFLTTGHLSPAWAERSRAAHTFVRSLFGELLRPDYGIYVAGSPETALTWRQADGGQPTIFENFAVAGLPSEASFADLQDRCIAHFTSFADEYGWTTLQVSDRSQEENHSAVFEVLGRGAIGHLFRNTSCGLALSRGDERSQEDRFHA